MKRLHQLVALILAVLWIPVAGHCIFEKMPGLEFLKCAADTEQGDCSGSGDACSQIENPNYKLSDTKVVIPQPAFAVLFHILIQNSVRNPVENQTPASVEVPPEISTTWQFSFRTALPPRAPSFVS